jgi:hypothetical protein
MLVDVLGMELAGIAGLDEVLCVNERSGPIKALTECFAHQSPRSDVAGAYAFMDIRQ